MTALSNTSLQFTINAGIGFLAIVVSVLLSRRQKNQKQISYYVITDIPVLNFKSEIKSKVQVSFASKPVNNIRLLVIKIWNTGNVPILPIEYMDPILIEFGENAGILDADVLETAPEDIKDKIKASIKIEEKRVVLEPILLNSNEYITLTVLVTQPQPAQLTKEIKVYTRIVGISKMQNFNRKVRPTRSLARAILFLSYFAFLVSVMYTLFSIYETNPLIKILYITLIILSAVFYLIVFVILSILFYSGTYKIPLSASFNHVKDKSIVLIKFLIDTSTVE